MSHRLESLSFQPAHLPMHKQEPSLKAFNFRGEWIEQLLQVKKERGEAILNAIEDDAISTPSLSPPSSNPSTAAHTPYGISSSRPRYLPLASEPSSLSRQFDNSPRGKGCHQHLSSSESSCVGICQVTTVDGNVDTFSSVQGRSSKRPNEGDPPFDDRSSKRPRISPATSHVQTAPNPAPPATNIKGWVRSPQPPISRAASEAAEDCVDLEDLEEGYSFWEILQGSCEDQFARGVRIPLAPILRIRGMPMLQMPKPQRLVAINYGLYERSNDIDVTTPEAVARFSEIRT